MQKSRKLKRTKTKNKSRSTFSTWNVIFLYLWKLIAPLALKFYQKNSTNNNLKMHAKIQKFSRDVYFEKEKINKNRALTSRAMWGKISWSSSLCPSESSGTQTSGWLGAAETVPLLLKVTFSCDINSLKRKKRIKGQNRRALPAHFRNSSSQLSDLSCQ